MRTTSFPRDIASQTGTARSCLIGNISMDTAQIKRQVCKCDLECRMAGSASIAGQHHGGKQGRDGGANVGSQHEGKHLCNGYDASTYHGVRRWKW